MEGGIEGWRDGGRDRGMEGGIEGWREVSLDRLHKYAGLLVVVCLIPSAL